MSISCECHLEVSATGRSLVQSSPTECGVSECDREALVMRRQWPTRVLMRQWGVGVGFLSV